MEYLVEEYTVSHGINLRKVLQYEIDLKNKDGWSVVTMAPRYENGTTNSIFVVFKKG